MKIEPLSPKIPDLDKITDYDVFFSSVSDKFTHYNKENLFIPTENPAFYAYKISSATGSYLGLIAGNSLSDIRNHHILPHEKTISSKEVHLQNLLTLRQAQIKPVLCTFKCPPSLHSYLSDICRSKPPLLSIPFESINELHQLWEVSDLNEISYLKNVFSNEVKDVYIADGHHRCSAVLNLHDQRKSLSAYPENLLVILLPIADLKIYEYNRVIDLEQSISSEELISKLADYFLIKRINKRITRPKTHVLNMLLDGNWYKLQWKKAFLYQGSNKELKLDTYLFNKYILKDIAGIEDVRRDTRITYVPGIYGIGGIKLMVNEIDGRVGFMLPKVKKDDLINISKRNLTMPPKSTWFEPRIKNGIVVIPFTKTQ